MTTEAAHAGPMKIVVVDHHRYSSVVRVGSHQVAAELLRRGHEVSAP
jgi:hypothetical protein